MVREVITSALQPGDCLLFARQSLINKAIAFKTWSEYTHVEVWLGPEVTSEICRRLGRIQAGERVFASRNPDSIRWNLKPVGGGVNLYRPDFDGLALVRRPAVFDVNAAIDWLSSPGILGQPYDVLGLFNFYLASRRGSDNGAMFCSEAATRLFKKTGTLVGENLDADKTDPKFLSLIDNLSNVLFEAKAA